MSAAVALDPPTARERRMLEWLDLGAGKSGEIIPIEECSLLYDVMVDGTRVARVRESMVLRMLSRGWIEPGTGYLPGYTISAAGRESIGRRRSS